VWLHMVNTSVGAYCNTPLQAHPNHHTKFALQRLLPLLKNDWVSGYLSRINVTSVSRTNLKNLGQFENKYLTKTHRYGRIGWRARIIYQPL
jgi:hypothetical protein